MSNPSAGKCPFHFNTPAATPAAQPATAQPEAAAPVAAAPTQPAAAPETCCAPAASGCPITKIKRFFGWKTGAKAAKFGAVGTASIFTLCGIKCIALYIILPSLFASAAFTSTDSNASSADPAAAQAAAASACPFSGSTTSSAAEPSKESAHESVPVSCPFHSMRNGGSGDAPVDTAQN